MLLSKSEMAKLSLDDASLLHERSEPFLADRSAPEHVRDVAMLFELDHQVRNGGFAQYFFNASCPNAFDAWFASEAIAPEAHELLGLALIRVGVEFGVDLDLRRIIQHDSKKLGPAYGSLLQIYKDAHTDPSRLLEDFASFRDRLAEPKKGHAGLFDLQMKFFAETNVPRSIVEHVLGSPEGFTR